MLTLFHACFLASCVYPAVLVFMHYVAVPLFIRLTHGRSDQYRKKKHKGATLSCYTRPNITLPSHASMYFVNFSFICFPLDSLFPFSLFLTDSMFSSKIPELHVQTHCKSPLTRTSVYGLCLQFAMLFAPCFV